MTQQSSSDGDSSTVLLILAGILASFLMLACTVVLAGWYFYRSIEVAADIETDQQSLRALPEKPDVNQPDMNQAVAEKIAPESSDRRSPDSAPQDVLPPRKERSEPSKSKQSFDPIQLQDAAEAEEKPALKYSWDAGKSLVYEFEIKADVNSRKIEYRGRNTIRGTGRRPNITIEEQIQEGSGTGFVIHPDGIVVTCAHVVENAKTIKATIGGSTLDATVIKMDTENDLAFLQLNADRLPYLKLADSDQVRLGQGVRAIGYPLSDVLGKSVKVTRGEVSGRGGPGGVDGLQIDASINPGNSGGPVVDNYGRLVGVASSLLAGRRNFRSRFCCSIEQSD